MISPEEETWRGMGAAAAGATAAAIGQSTHAERHRSTFDDATVAAVR
jgi:hypothetical protein